MINVRFKRGVHRHTVTTPIDQSYLEARRPEREVNLRTATIAAIWGTDDADPTDEGFAAWMELVRRERVYRPEVA